MADVQRQFPALSPPDLKMLFKDNGDGTYSPVVAATLQTNPTIDIGEVRIEDPSGTVANVKAATAIAEQDNVLGVQAPVLGVTTGAAVVTNAPGTVQQFLRGLVTLIAAGLPASLGQKLMAMSLPVTIASDQAAVPVSVAAPTNSTSAAYETNRVAKASTGTLWGLSGYNSKTSAQFIQVHDAASLPADTAVPKVLITVPASSGFSIDFGTRGRAFTTGIVLCNSSTGPAKTLGAADCWFDVQYT